jgi:hypothetical protein
MSAAFWLVKWIALLFSLCLMAGAAGADEMKMHRKQAGEPDKSGWMLAKSTEGRFSVRLPLKFNDFTVTEADPNAPAARTYTVGARSSERIAVVATRIAYRKGAAAAKEYFARFEKGQGLGAAPESVTPRRVGALRAMDLVLKRPTDVIYQRVVLLDADLLLMSVEAPREHDATARELAATFFDSLQVDAK